jgi:hypothetical protein
LFYTGHRLLYSEVIYSVNANFAQAAAQRSRRARPSGVEMPDRLDYYFYMSEKNPAAVELGRRGGLKGGKARAAKMTPEERFESARKAAKAVG